MVFSIRSVTGLLIFNKLRITLQYHTASLTYNFQQDKIATGQVLIGGKNYVDIISGMC